MSSFLLYLERYLPGSLRSYRRSETLVNAKIRENTDEWPENTQKWACLPGVKRQEGRREVAGRLWFLVLLL